MQKINSEATLRDAIVQLEHRRAHEEKMLREQFHLARESMKPINLIKSTFIEAISLGKDAIASPDVKDNILNTSVGLAAGYVSKLLFVNVSRSPLRKLLGIALQFGITKLVAKNPQAIKSMGKGVMNLIKSKLTSNTVNEQQANENYTGNY